MESRLQVRTCSGSKIQFLENKAIVWKINWKINREKLEMLLT